MVINPDWRDYKVKKISPGDFAALLAKKGTFVLDVRPLEFSRNNSFIPGSTHCPLVYLDKYYDEIPPKCDILLVDWAMISSTNAAKFLLSKGYRVKGVLKGGIERWITEQRMVEVRPEEPVPFTFTWKRRQDDCM
jgi:rhodanese-related sulfurtransferase